MSDLPDFPLFDVSDADVAFGCRRDRYAISRADSTTISRQLKREADVFSALFFSGGGMRQFGLVPRDGIDEMKARRALKALMCSFDPPHEVKEATCALAIHRWWQFQDASQ